MPRNRGTRRAGAACALAILAGGLLRVARISLAVTFDLPDADHPARPARPDAHTEPLPRHPE